MLDILPGEPLPAAALRQLAEPPACSVFATSPQSAPPGTTHTWLNAAGVNYDPYGMHSPSATSRITIPVSGTYLFTATMAFAANSSGTYRLAAFRLNGSGAINLNTVGPAGGAVSTVITCMRTFGGLVAGDYIEAGARHDASGALNIDLREFNAVLLTR